MSIGERWLIGSMIVTGSIVAVPVVVYSIHVWRLGRSNRSTQKRINRLP